MKYKLFFSLIAVLYSCNLWAQLANNAPLKLRVATYNVGHFNQGNFGGLETRGKAQNPTRESRHTRLSMFNWREWIGSQSLDFFCVQEWNRNFDQDSVFNATDELLKPFYNNISFGDEHTWIYNGIATNYKLTNLRQHYWAGDYYALIGDLKIGDKIVTVISTHIPWQEEWHAAAIDSILAELKKYEYFMCFGDMNASDAEQLRFVENGFNMANGGYQGWFGTSAGALQRDRMEGGADRNIDNIVTSKNIKIRNVSAPKTGLNDQDHLPVLADLIITW